MRLLLSWVRDFVDVTAPIEEIAETLALRGFEYASIDTLENGDGVVDFEVTANRPDCLSVVGFAREIATVYDLPFRPLSAERGGAAALVPVTIGESPRIDVTIEDAELCPRYAAAVVDAAPGDVRSPGWMIDRLHAAGIRPISPFVDITNYVLIELGHPMHAFDLAQLAGGELRIRRAAAGETLKTLDGIERKLEPDMLVIADAHRAQAVAGVMGGAQSEVSATTRSVVFESAYFKPSSVRRTSKRLGLKTEASARFERGADVNAPVVAVQRALALLHQIGAGHSIGPVVDRYPQPREGKTLRLRHNRLVSLLGIDVPDAETERILQSLGLAVSRSDDGWNVVAPTFRVDLQREVDLIEEVGRHHGFDKLEPAFPTVSAAAPAPDARIIRDELVRRALTAAGLSEAVSFGFIEAKTAEAFGPSGGSDGLVGVANPLSAKFDTLRPSLVPGLVDAVAHNRRHGRRDVALFEIGARFTAAEGETRGVGLAWTGAAEPEHWSGGARHVDFFDLKGVVEQLCEVLAAPIRLDPTTLPWLVPGQTAAVFAGGARVGALGLVSPAVVEARGAPKGDKVFAAELDLDRLAAARQARDERVRPLPRHPVVVRDLSIVVADTLPAAIIRGTIQAAAAAGDGSETAASLVAIAFFDRYKGKGVPEGSISVSIRLTFQAADRTLTDADVQQTFDKILAALRQAHGAVQR
jgi:phenylalanyl-tRNA synthetase beta chain